MEVCARPQCARWRSDWVVGSSGTWKMVRQCPLHSYDPQSDFDTAGFNATCGSEMGGPGAATYAPVLWYPTTREECYEHASIMFPDSKYIQFQSAEAGACTPETGDCCRGTSSP